MSAASRVEELRQTLCHGHPENYGAILGNCALALIGEGAGDPVANTSRAIDVIREARRFFPEGGEQRGLSLLHEGIAHSTLAQLGSDQSGNLAIAERAFRQAMVCFPAGSAWAGGCLMNLAQLLALRVSFGLATTSSLVEAVSLYQQARARLPPGVELANCLAGEAEVRFRLAKHGADPVPNLQVSINLYRAACLLVPLGDERRSRWPADRAAALLILAEHGVRSRENVEEALRDLLAVRPFFSPSSEQFATCLSNETSVRLLLVQMGVDVDTHLHAILETSGQAEAWASIDPAASVGLLLNGAAAHLEIAHRGAEVQANFALALRLCARARRAAGHTPELATRCALLAGTIRSAIGETGNDAQRQLARAIRLFGQVREAKPPSSGDLLAAFLNEALARERLACVGVDSLGHLDSALALYREAKAIASANSAGLARCLNGESRVRVIQAEHNDRTRENLMSAVRLSDASADICRAEGLVTDLAIALITKATALQALADEGVDGPSNLDAAIETYGAAIELTRREALVRYRGTTLMNQGTALLTRGWERERSQADVLQALALFQEAALLFPPDERTALDCLLNEGIAYQYLFEMGVDRAASLDRAALLFSRAGEQLAALGHPGRALKAFKNLGLLLLAQERAAEAVVAFDRAIAASEESRAGTVLPRDRQKLLEDQASLYLASVEACLACGQDKRALELVERSRARGLQDLLDDDGMGRSGLTAETSGQSRDLRRRAAAIEARLSGRSAALYGVADLAVSVSLAAERRKVREEMAALETIPIVDGRSLSIQEILAVPSLLARPVVVLSVGRQRSMAFLVTTEGGLERISLPDLDLSVVMRWLVGSPEERGLGGWMGTYVRLRELEVGRPVWRAVMEEVLRDAYARLMEPIHRRLRGLGARRMALVVAGQLSVLPLHAASWTEGGRTRYVAEDMEILYAPATAVLKHTVERRHEEPTRFLGVMTSGDGATLKFAEWELLRVAAVVGARLDRGATLTLFDSGAVRSEVVRLVSTCPWLHFSCHGASDPTDPRDSALSLHGGERFDLADLLALTPAQKPRLVVMSACETAVSTTALTLGGEFLGLPAGWLVAGAQSVIGSLWTVADAPTALLMIRMSELLVAGNEIPTALAEAQRWLRNLDVETILTELESDPLADRDLVWQTRALLDGLGEHPFAHPDHWAGFVACGSPDPLFGAHAGDSSTSR